jgi:hypothetical protein
VSSWVNDRSFYELTSDGGWSWSTRRTARRASGMLTDVAVHARDNREWRRFSAQEKISVPADEMVISPDESQLNVCCGRLVVLGIGSVLGNNSLLSHRRQTSRESNRLTSIADGIDIVDGVRRSRLIERW